jgi:hypothetical protein
VSLHAYTTLPLYWSGLTRAVDVKVGGGAGRITFHLDDASVSCDVGELDTQGTFGPRVLRVILNEANPYCIDLSRVNEAFVAVSGKCQLISATLVPMP